MEEFLGKNLIIMACSKCNINCKHCYVSYKGNRSPGELLQLVTGLSKKYNIILNGAEILTDINYLKSFEYINQNYFMSNGVAIYNNPEILDTIISYGITSISLSYHFGIQDDISVMTPEKIEKVINLILQKGLQVRLLTTITSHNYDKITKMCKKAEQLGARGIKFTNFILQGNATNMDAMNVLTDNEKYEFFRQLDMARNLYDKNNLIIERCGTFGVDLYNKKNNFRCDAINNTVVLTPDNNIYPCIFLAKPGYEIGKFEDGKIFINDKTENLGNICYADDLCNVKSYANLKKKMQ